MQFISPFHIGTGVLKHGWQRLSLLLELVFLGLSWKAPLLGGQGSTGSFRVQEGRGDENTAFEKAKRGKSAETISLDGAQPSVAQMFPIRLKRVLLLK